MTDKGVLGEYAQSGVDYTKIQGFKDAMVAAGKTTLEFPNRRGIYLPDDVLHSHGAVYGCDLPDHVRANDVRWCLTKEGLGNKNWIAERMYELTGDPHYLGIGYDNAMMAVNDVIAQGAMPVVYADEVAAGDSDWFTDTRRSAQLADSFYQACADAGMALGAGESPALRYLVKSEEPVKSAPVLSGSVVGLIYPKSRLITGQNLQAGDLIIGATASGLHANGISLVIKRGIDRVSLPDGFMTMLPTGRSFGDEALIPTRCYVNLIETWLENYVQLHALLPGTGDGVGKLAFDKREFTYRVTDWTTEIPPLFQFMMELGVSLMDCLKTFNMGIGYYAFVPKCEADRACELGKAAGYDVMIVGQVEDGPRQTIVESGRILNDGTLILPPPGD